MSTRSVLREQEFAPDPTAAKAVRRFVREAMPSTAPADEIVLTASELATHVMRHAGTTFTVRLEVDPRNIHLEVSDGSSTLAAVEDLVRSGRRLRVVDAVCRDWGIEGNQKGTTVWADFDHLPAASS